MGEALLHVPIVCAKWEWPHVVVSFLDLAPDALLRDAFVIILFLDAAMVTTNTRHQIPAIFVEPFPSYSEQLVLKTTHAHDVVLVVICVPSVLLVTTRTAHVM